MSVRKTLQFCWSQILWLLLFIFLLYLQPNIKKLERSLADRQKSITTAQERINNVEDEVYIVYN